VGSGEVQFELTPKDKTTEFKVVNGDFTHADVRHVYDPLLTTLVYYDRISNVLFKLVPCHSFSLVFLCF